MLRVVKTAIAATLLGVTALAAVEPAQARGDTGAAIAAGIIGLGVGAAIASDHPHYRQVQYYYAPPPEPYVYYPPPQYGYGYDPDWQARRYWQHRRWEEARRRHWEHERWEHRRWHRDWDDDDD